MKILKNNEIVCKNTLYANTPLKRLIGLLGKTDFVGIDGLLLSPCNQIHTFGMKFIFDAVYLDKNYKIISLHQNIPKNKLLPYKFYAKHVLELPKNTIIEKKLEIGDVLKINKK